MIEFFRLGVVTQFSEGAGNAVQLEVLELVGGGMLQHDVSLMEIMRATDIGVIDRRSVRGLSGCAAIEVVLEDGANRGVRPCPDLQGPFTGGLQPFASMGPSQAKDADARAEPLFGMGFATQDDVDQDLGIGPVGGGVATDAGWGSTGVTTVCGGHMLGHGGVA